MPGNKIPNMLDVIWSNAQMSCDKLSNDKLDHVKKSYLAIPNGDNSAWKVS